MPGDNENQAREQDPPTSDLSAASNVEQRQHLLDELVNHYRQAGRGNGNGGSVIGGRDLDQYGSWLAEARAYFKETSNRDLSLSLAAEWVLDNYYIIRQALTQIKEDLPAGFYARLPKLIDGPMKGLPRIYAMGRGVLSFQNYLLNGIELQEILIQVQDQIPLTMGELWALPIFLRYGLIEALAQVLLSVIRPQSTPDLPAFLQQPFGNAEYVLTNEFNKDEAAASGIVANIIYSLRAISEQNWNDFFEAVSRLERKLREDPAGIYPLMDFKTRDIYRKELEALSLSTGCEENELVESLLNLARETGSQKTGPGRDLPAREGPTEPLPESAAHVGEYLLGKGRARFEKIIGYRPDALTALKRWGLRNASALYLSSIFFIALLSLFLISVDLRLPVLLATRTTPQIISLVVLGLALLVPILTVSTSLVNWLITLVVKPRILPKLHFRDEIPEPFQTLVVIPALLTNREEIDHLVRQLEMHFLRNPEPGLIFGLLSDFLDADRETLDEDEEIVRYAAVAIESLNSKYEPAAAAAEKTPLFYLFHRARLWNPSENKWIGWERKRGKLNELNRLLRGDQDTSFSTFSAGLENDPVLQRVRFVITLDADTILPRGAARRLVGTLAHPLNRARFKGATNQVLSGYTVLQPRMEIHPRSANLSWFTRIFGGDTGLDLYTLSVSDAYQDLFGEGSYVGKGIYDVDAFERSVDKHIPENSVLSHDLLEGIMGRAGLVTDITMIEDYPENYFVQVKRQKRWMRGDWQLLPWLIRPGRFKVHFSAIDRWKMLDNLLRAMLSPALLLIFILSIFSAPEFALFWLAIILFSYGVPVLTSMARSTIQTLGGEKIGAAFHPLRWSLVRWLLAIAFLPYEAYNALDAILTTLYRLFVSHRDLLQWTTAAQAARLFGKRSEKTAAWLKMSTSTLLVLILIGSILFLQTRNGSGISQILSIETPLLLLWIASPWIAQWINQPIRQRTVPLSQEQIALFRQVARRTWGFFERFVSPEDHWLPPDHFQEAPVGIIAHHSSPSNFGLFLTATLAAYDFGYLDQLALATRLSTTMETLELMERYRGHFLNWYDTLTLQPLHPRYISTVDSGNLAACFIVVAQACKSMADEHLFRWELWQGYLDTLHDLSDVLKGMQKAGFHDQAKEIIRRIAELDAEILDSRTQPTRWYALFQKASGPFWEDISNRLIELVKTSGSVFNLEALRQLQGLAAKVEGQHLAVKRTIEELVPWIILLEQVPDLFKAPPFLPALEQLKASLPYNPVLGQVYALDESGMSTTAVLRDLLQENPSGGTPAADRRGAAPEWLDALDHAMTRAKSNAAALVEKFLQIATRSEQFVQEMDFRFLYHPQRRVFHIGFNLDAGMLDKNYYDLLASEARIASIIALAKGEIPQSHWLQLSRPLTRVEGMHVLLSWSATMFEYLMPPLFMRSYPGTLLADSSQGAVLLQTAYGKSKGVPWGFSESGFYQFDANQNYQYRAFGVPGLGFKRGLGDDLVVAPYASLMAIGYDPQSVAQNLASLLEYNSFGQYGLYEAIDFTAERLPLGETSMLVREYMAHHQGMVFMALDNYFHEDIMVRRMHSDPRIQSVELLLQEQIPLAVPLQNPYAEDVKGVLRLTAGPVDISPWSVPVHTAIPFVNLLSNGNYSVLLSNMGGGYSSWRGTDLTRWQADGVLDPWGTWIYLQDMDLVSEKDRSPNAQTWSAGFQPISGSDSNMKVTFFAHMAVYRRTENDITSTMEVTVYPDEAVEIRRIHLLNTLNQRRRLRLTSYGEVILAPQVADSRHPAFNKLFIESEFVPELNLQIFTRRPRSNDESPVFMGHMLVLRGKGSPFAGQPPARHEADRNRFIGRNRTLRDPAALVSGAYLTGSSGATLDPIFALGQEIELVPHGNAELAYLTFAGDSREAILALADRFVDWSLIERSFSQANIAAQTWLGKQNYDSLAFKNTLQVLSALIYPFKVVRAAPEILSANRLGQSGLWRFGISGDFPILLVELDDSKQVELVREVLQVHEFLRSRRLLVDVVILNQQLTEYGAELNGKLFRLVNRLNAEPWLNQRGGIFIHFADQMKAEELTLLRTAARFIFSGERGSLDDQIPAYPIQVHHLPEFVPTRATEGEAGHQEEPRPPAEPLQFFNGYGGFSQDGREYVIQVSPGKPTPAPWVNVIGYPDFGFMVSETGSQCTWAGNSGENRLTPWFNDPVMDPSGEALYLRDEETGEVWTPTPNPAGAGQPIIVRHGAGYTIFEHRSHGLGQRLTIFGSPDDPVKIIHLQVKNLRNYARRITVTQYIEWVLGLNHSTSMPYILPEYDADEECLLAANPFSAEFNERVAFLIANKKVHGLTADRTEFLGRGGSLASPASLRRIGLETRLSPGEDPCAVLQLHLDLLPGVDEEVYFVLGQGRNKEHALELVRKYHEPGHAGAALERTRVFWDHLLGTVHVHTPEPAMDLILNRWMLYQSLSCRIWGRSAFYQSSGAFGFRDQIQDVLALLPVDPPIARGQILNAALRQFAEGDVLHWWHPPSGRGVRTRFSDDLLWLPYVTALYVESTGDAGILDDKIPFLDAPPLKKDENERYNHYPQTLESFSLLEHCYRAIAKGTTHGPHGLPLIGTGDWNDGMNRVGIEGKGESVWLAWFLCDVLERFAKLCERLGNKEQAAIYRGQVVKYKAAVERSAWDGAWYRRAYYDDGAPLGSIEDTECQIDAIAQSWAVLSGAGDPQRSRQAMQSVVERLVHAKERLSLLFTPPLDQTQHDPGYIKGYLPGIRENGGQYTHAAIWTAWAFANLGDADQAHELFNLLNPVLQSDTPEKISQYRVEPYVICADIYSQPPYLGRGGWTWYTGSAAWIYRLGLTAILGFEKTGNVLRINPAIPSGWTGYEIRYQFGNASYQITIHNPRDPSREVTSVILDGKALDEPAIPLVDDGQCHRVEVILGVHGVGVSVGAGVRVT